VIVVVLPELSIEPDPTTMVPPDVPSASALGVSVASKTLRAPNANSQLRAPRALRFVRFVRRAYLLVRILD
jgi:hypothetical protein